MLLGFVLLLICCLDTYLRHSWHEPCLHYPNVCMSKEARALPRNFEVGSQSESLAVSR
jgi:hypothetical protein